MQVADLIRYNHVVRGLYLDVMAKLPWAEVVKPRGLSFDSMCNVFLHLTFVEDRMIGFIIPGRFKEWVDRDFEAYKDMESLKSYRQQVENQTDASLTKLSAEELNRQIIIPWGPTPDTRVSVETALTQIVVEDMIHYGELSAALWQMGKEAPYMGFWRYKCQNP